MRQRSRRRGMHCGCAAVLPARSVRHCRSVEHRLHSHRHLQARHLRHCSSAAGPCAAKNPPQTHRAAAAPAACQRFESRMESRGSQWVRSAPRRTVQQNRKMRDAFFSSFTGDGQADARRAHNARSSHIVHVLQYCNMLLSTVLYAGMRERVREVGACHQGEKACNRRSRHEREAPAQTTCIQ